MSSFATFIARLMQIERRKDGRVPAHGVKAFYKVSTEEQPVRIRDISATGIYLITQERWSIGSNVSVTLRRQGLSGNGKSSEVRMTARVTRWGEDGVGLTFVPSYLAPSEWSMLMEHASSASWHHDIISRFRSASAMAFLSGICPEVHQEILLMLGDDLYNDRAQRVVDIALNAADLLSEHLKHHQFYLAPHLLLRVVQEGSQSSSNDLSTFWAGLLASCCLKTSDPNASMVFIETLAQLNLMQLRILTAGCNAAVTKGWNETGESVHIYCTQQEIRKIAGVRNLGHIERDLQHLHSLGLIEQTRTARLFGAIEQANLTPTPFGMKLYLRCCGHFRPSLNHGY